jgi:hypothetical protein
MNGKINNLERHAERDDYRESSSFSNVAELETLVLGMDEAKLVSVSTFDDGNHDATEKVAEEYRGVWNTSRNLLEAVVSDRYHLIENKIAFLPVVDAIRKFGIKIKGKMLQENGRSYIDILFDDERFKLDVADKSKMQKGDTINFGMRFGNSYDASMSFYAETFAIRMVCSNGMIRPVVIEDIRFVHMGEPEVISSAILKTFEALIIECPKFRDVVERTMKDEVTEALIQEYLNVCKLGKRNIEKLLEKARKVDAKTQWDVYNVLTEYITHDLQIMESSRESWHKNVATPLLEKPIEVLIQRKKKGAE